MSWTNELYKVYESNCGNTECDPQLLPVSHSTANAQIELTLSESGEFKSARTVVKSDAVTVIPVTEDSAVRSSNICPHPFADKLVYIAGDYGDYVSDNKDCFEAYLAQLKAWEQSDSGHAAVTAVYRYLEKRCLIKDLIAAGVLIQDDESGRLKDKVSIEGIKQEDAFVRFRIEYADIMRESRTWEDKTLYDCFIKYNSDKIGNVQLCYATGRELPCTYKHPSKIRNSGDRGRLISSNDESGFAYRGRFDNKEQALSVSYDFSQKMHNALKWLIRRQGVNIENSLMLVIWESALRKLPNPIVSYAGLPIGEEVQFADTYPAYRQFLSETIFGYRLQLKHDSKAMVMGLDSATTGRLSIVLYSELSGSGFLTNVENWHRCSSWLRFNGKLKATVVNSFSLKDLIECAFGTEQGSFIKCKPKVMTDYMCRLIPCVTENRNIPKELVTALVNKASNPLAYSEYYNWQKVLEAACAMLRKARTEKTKNEEEKMMALDLDNCERSYLFGRLLAVADKAESDSYDETDKNKRITNARRYWQRFSTRPSQTWKVIEERLIPYINKLEKGKAVYYQSLMNEIMRKFITDDYTSSKRLEPSYLLAYHNQSQEFYKSKKNKEE